MDPPPTKTTMRPLLLLTLLLASACATTASAPSGPPPPDRESRILTTGSGADVYIAGDVRAQTVIFAATPDRVWSELLAVYEEMEIPLTTVDRRAGRMGNGQFMALRRLAGRPMTSYVNCGSNITGAIAATNRIQMSVTSELAPVGGDSTRVQTWITAVAHSIEGASRNAMACNSTGALERQVADRLGRRLSGS